MPLDDHEKALIEQLRAEVFTLRVAVAVLVGISRPDVHSVVVRALKEARDLADKHNALFPPGELEEATHQLEVAARELLDFAKQCREAYEQDDPSSPE